MRLCGLAALLGVVVTGIGCRPDLCESLPAQAQIDVVLEEIPAGVAASSLVVLSVNKVEVWSHHFDKAAPSFLFKFEDHDLAPRELAIAVSVSDQAGVLVGWGRLDTTFSPDGCNHFTVAVRPRGPADAGPDWQAPDGGVADGAARDADGPAPDLPPDGRPFDVAQPDVAQPDTAQPDTSVDTSQPDLPWPDQAVPDLAVPDQAVPDMLQPDAPASDVVVVVPGTWVTVPPQGTSLPVTFWMGAPPGASCNEVDEVKHQVTLTRAFEISAHEVTQAQFQLLTSYNPARFPMCGPDCPVSQVSWYQAAAHCNALSLLKGLEACYSCSGSGPAITCSESAKYSGSAIYDCPGYRLPTDAEWEYAYRAGSNTDFYPSPGNNGTISVCQGAPDANVDKIGWYKYNGAVTYPGCYDLSSLGGPSCTGVHPVGQKAPNAWGLYDMAGNVFEWCHDWYQADLGSSPVTDPWGAVSAPGRVGRGGSYYWDAFGLRAAFRHSNLPWFQLGDVGFRCARTLNP